MHYDLAILGAGAAGMMAAVAAAERLHPLTTDHWPLATVSIAIFEKNVRPGIKVLVCGGGRCNFTNAGSREFLIDQFGRDGRFLTPALEHLDNQALRDFFAARGVPSHEEHDGKIYPDSNQARSVVDALVSRMQNLGIAIHTGPAGTVTSVQQPQDSPLKTQTFSLITAAGESHTARAIILALGGMSYQRMGTTGDGYRIAQSLGHTLVTPRPAIVGLLTEEPWIKDLQGLAMRDVEVTITPPPSQKSRFKTQKSHGDMLFTHFGLSGPAILNPSEIVAELLEHSPAVPLKIDFARHHTHEHLHALFRDWQQHQGKKQFRKLLSHNAPEITIRTTSPDQTAITQDSELRTQDFSLPRRLAGEFCQLESVPPEQSCSTLTAAQIHRLIERIKSCPFTITATRGFKEAMVTAGGIPLREVDPKTLESRIVSNLFLTGEILDLTGPSGGYNLQLAFSTGHLAGTTIAKRLQTS